MTKQQKPTLLSALYLAQGLSYGSFTMALPVLLRKVADSTANSLHRPLRITWSCQPKSLGTHDNIKCIPSLEPDCRLSGYRNGRTCRWGYPVFFAVTGAMSAVGLILTAIILRDGEARALLEAQKDHLDA